MLAKIKLNSIETLVTQALIDMEIIHEEFVMIQKKRDNFEKMKKKCVNVYKMCLISAEGYKNAGIHVLIMKKHQ